MKRFNITDVYQDSEPDDDSGDPSPTMENLIKDLQKQPSTKLADVIVGFRYLGLYKDLSILAMEELSKRRESGDSFQFESYIDDSLQGLPKLDFKIPNIEGILKSFGGIKL